MSYNEDMLYQTNEWAVPKSWRNWMVVLVIVFLLDRLGRMQWLRQSAIWLTRPVSGLVVSVARGASSQIRYLAQWNGLVKHNIDLERQILEDQVALDRVVQLESENRELREILEIKEKLPVTRVIGRIVQVDSAYYRVWLESPVPVGTPILHNEQLIGVVAESSGSVARVDRVGWGSARVVAKIDTVTGNTTGTVEMTGTELAIARVQTELKVATGNGVTTVGDANLVPAGLPISRVKEVIAPPEAVFQTIKLLPQPEVSVGDMVSAIGERK